MCIGVPKITKSPKATQNLSIVSGNEQVTLTCEVTGDNITGGYWERVGGRSLSKSKNMSSINDDKTNLQLTINEARPRNSGMYRCVVYSQWGVAQSEDVQVTIKSKRNNVIM